jgi:uncharacterized Zn-finger protein
MYKKNNEVTCINCDAEFVVDRRDAGDEMDVKYCPYCGEDIYTEEEMEELDFDESDDGY